MIFAFILVLTCYTQVDSKCKEINTFKNGFPLGLKQLSENDYFGPFIILSHNTLLDYLKMIPQYKSVDCNTHLIKTGKQYVKYSWRPRGCCELCCHMDRVEDYLSLYFFTKNNTVDVITLSNKKKLGTLAALGFRNDSKTIIYVHRFADDGFVSSAVKEISDAYLKRKEHFNVLSLDYSELIPVPWYLEGMDAVPYIASAISKFLIFYHKTGELRIENIHIVGLSLGAQIASFIGKEVGKFKKVARITGLDPSITIYPENDPDKNIHKGDAEFVDIIHTTSGIYGIRTAKGDADFFVEYPPDLINRPGCDYSKALEKNEVADYYFCDHIRSAKMYVHTIANPYLFPVCKKGLNGSEVCGYVGYAADKHSCFGEYHFTTSPKWDPWEEVDTID